MQSVNPQTNDSSPKKVSLSYRTVLACMGGNIIEWYDFMIYGYFSSIIGRVFFPGTDQIASLLLSLSIFAIGVIARPVGGILLGHIGDKISRRTSLLISVYGMFGATVMIGLLPSYHEIGIIAPVLLFVLRMLQGLAMGGEYAGVMVFLSELAPMKKRGLYGSFAALSLVLGMVLGAGSSALINGLLMEEEILAWGWRIPFFVSVIGLIYTIYMRRILVDPNYFRFMKEKNRTANNPFNIMWCHFRDHLWQSILLQTVLAIGMYTVTIYSINSICEFHLLSKTQALAVNMMATLVLGASAVISGWLSDTLGRKNIIIFSCFLITASGFTSVYLAQSKDIYVYSISQILLAFSIGQFLGVTPSALADLFPIQIRYTATAFTNNLAMGIFGGTAPMVILYGINQTGDSFFPAYYLAFGALVSLVFALVLFGKKQNYV
jgi:MHS family proline/betaine transporter-like MFS transporter